MSKYNETAVVGESWIRSNKIVCSNDYGQPPTIYYQEEELFIFSDGKVVKSLYNTMSPAMSPAMSPITERFTPNNANTTFELINPETELPTGNTATYQDLYVLMHSLYFHLVKKRDRREKPHLSWIWNEINQQWESPVPKPEGDYWIWDEEFKQWVDTRPPYPSDGNEYIWENGSWVQINNGT